MTRLIRTELLKLRTARVGYGLLLIAAATTALFASLEASRNGRSVAPISTASGLSSVTTTTGFAMVIAAVLGVIAASGEFRHGSATLTYLAVPKRARVLVAKAGAAACAGAVIGLTAGIVATGVGLGFAAGHSDPITLGAGTLAGHLAGAGLGAALMAVLGVAAGSLVRSQLAAVIGVFVWCLVVESIVGGLVTSVRPYLPYTAASTLAGAKLGAAAFGPGYSISAQPPLPFAAGAALLAGLFAALALLAAGSTLRQDVT